MVTSTRSMTAVAAAVGLLGCGWGAGSASAEVANGGMAPIKSSYRSCDFTPLSYIASSGFGSGYSVIGTGGGSTVTADVHLSIGIPNTPYQVRLIQGPRPGSQTCNSGDPGVTSAVLNTDGNGTGEVTLQGPLRPGAANAWVFLLGPPKPGTVRGEFYTSDVVTSLK